MINTEDKLKDETPHFAKPVLCAVPSVVYNEDCVEGLKRFSDNYFDLCVTDPPYELTSGGGSRDIWGGFFKSSEYDNKGKLFEIPKPEIWMAEIFRTLKEVADLYCFIYDKNLNYFLTTAFEVGFKLHNILVMVKDTHTPNRWYIKNCEYVLYLYKGKAKNINNMGDKTAINVQMPKNKIHPSEKPVSYIEKLIKNSCPKDGIIIEPFVGSGSCRLASYKYCRFVGFEIDKNYYEAQEKRFQTFISQLRMF